MCYVGTDGNFLQFEEGYLVETVVEGNELGVVPYKIRVSEDGELFAVDAINSKIVRITPPLSQCKLFFGVGKWLRIVLSCGRMEIRGLLLIYVSFAY